MALPARTEADVYHCLRDIATLAIPSLGGNAGIKLVRHRPTQALGALKKFLSHDRYVASREFHITRILQGLPNIIRLYDCYSEHYNRDSWRGGIITEYCKYGTLDDLISRYDQAHYRFPEAFIWHVFVSLTNALVSLEHGPQDGRSWNWVLHHDIWPANVFLSAGTGNRSGYPKILLGDFGSSITKNEVEARRFPLQWRQQRDFSPLAPQTPQSLGPQNDRCQVGLVILALCHVTMRPRAYMNGNRPTLTGLGYSARLEQVLKMCFMRNSHDRPRSIQVRDHVAMKARRLRANEDRTVYLQEGYVNAEGAFAKRSVCVVG